MSKLIRSLFAIEYLLLIAMLALTGAAVESLSTSTPHVSFWVVAVGGTVLGITLGRIGSPDSFSHLIAIMSGAAGTIALTSFRQLPGEESLSFWDRFGRVAIDLKDWYFGTAPRESLEDLLIMILLQMIVWLIAYLSAWSLVRQGWLTFAILLPAILVLVSILFGSQTPDNLLEIFIVIAIVLMARVAYMQRLKGQQIPGSVRGDGVSGWIALIPALIVALVVVGAGTATPRGFSNDTIRPVASYAGEQYLETQEQALDWIAQQFDLSGSGSVSLDSFPRYTAFDSAFSVGGDLNLSDQPEVLVKVNGEAPYLAAQSYDTYTGRGWESTVEDTFDADGPDGVRYSPELTFRPGQEIPYSTAVFRDRVPVPMQVIPLTPSGDAMFRSGMYLTSDERASVRMSWLQLNAYPFHLREMDLSTVPPDLTGVVLNLLQASTLSVEGADGLLYPADAVERDRLMSIRGRLGERFIDVSWTVAADGKVDTMIVSGQLPVYEDTVRVSRATGEANGGGGYSVTSLVSEATSDELRSASSQYPEWVQDRYLELPESVTSRTVELAMDVTISDTNPYDQAKSIEAFLRQHITYDLNIESPPAGEDIVDYVLFSSRRGYCEYYASAMTVMLRALGIPAKTVVGYFPGELDSARGGYVYRQENAHAWTEAYFTGYGWIRFEPTASQPASTFGDIQFDPQPTPTPTTVVPTELPMPPGTATPVSNITGPEPDIAEPVSVESGDDTGIPWIPISMAALAGLAVIGAGIWLFLSRSSGLEARSLFTSLVRWGRAVGVRADSSTTPREYAQRLRRRFPDLGTDAFDVVTAYEEHRYGNAAPSPSRLERAARSLRRLRRQMIRSMIRRR